MPLSAQEVERALQQEIQGLRRLRRLRRLDAQEIQTLRNRNECLAALLEDADADRVGSQGPESLRSIIAEMAADLRQLRLAFE